jgi:hypothetical protein
MALRLPYRTFCQVLGRTSPGRWAPDYAALVDGAATRNTELLELHDQSQHGLAIPHRAVSFLHISGQP